jgi:hypothetical protein
VLASGSDSQALTLSGKAAELSAYLATAGRILLSAPVGDYTLTVSASVTGLAPVEKTAAVKLYATASRSTPILSGLPTTLPITTGVASTLALGSSVTVTGQGQGPLTLTLSSAGNLVANVLEGDAVIVGGSGQALTLSGEDVPRILRHLTGCLLALLVGQDK